MKKNISKLKIFLYLSIPITLLLILLLMLGHLAWAKKYEARIYPGINIGELSLGGLTKEDAQKIITAQAEKLENNGLIFELNGKQAVITGQMMVNSTDFTNEAFQINRALTLEKAFNQGRETAWLTGFSRWIFGNWNSYHLKTEYQLNRDVLIKALKQSFDGQESEKKNAELKIDSQGELEITPEKNGVAINYEAAIQKTQAALASLSSQTIKLETTSTKPDTSSDDLLSLITEAKKINDLAPIKISADGNSVSVNKNTLISWIKASENKTINLDKEKISLFLEKNLTPKVDQEVQAPRFEIKNGKMAYWQNGKEGKKINLENSTQQIISEILEKNNRNISLNIEIIPFVSPESNEIVIKELLGTGHSNFAGSPSNRRKNISVGASTVHGLLIKPGEEFSLVKSLGEIDGKNGYLEELVIKNNKTIPEFGGGLCQIGTTIFRAALSSGLPITARQNHSYRVSYYEPAGTDAAIYDPNPDVRFLNDTGNYILIQSRIVKNDIYFEFWGVKDGRQATSTKPTIFNIVKPAEPKTIISPELKPGEKKCTEKAHNGADAFFDYKVIYPNGTVKEKRFKSHYVPWQEVCLIGAPQKATSTPEIISSSTPATSTTPNSN